ncbi:unnamed protein product [Oikopleura dioica]|uniref:Uncharacterized protein n=1 Tax=Oikopleura dioica TaxID=34765 RepID=E4YW93_OIKDI|nr:unnamed protein product [Oikopleura dioica]
MCRARIFFCFVSLASVSSLRITRTPDGEQISDELEATLRCLIRTWIRFEWAQNCENCVIPTEDQLPQKKRLPECTPEALEGAGIKVTQILAGGNRVWNAVSGWIQRSVSAVPERKPSFLDQTRAISLWQFTENSAFSGAFFSKTKKNRTQLMHFVASISPSLLTSNKPDDEGLRQKNSLREGENRITVGAHHANYLYRPCFLV